MEQLDLIVIGAGISGVAVAARAHAAGLSVAVIEQHATVAQGASFAHSGMVLPSPLDPWFGPSARAQDSDGPFWGRKARIQARDDARLQAYRALEAFIALSRETLQETCARHDVEFEARSGGLYVFRSKHALDKAKGLSPALIEAGVKHRFLEPAECKRLEPALFHADDMTGAIALDALLSGNCALAAKRLKAALAAEGVDFLLARRAVGLRVEAMRVAVDVQLAKEAAGAFAGIQAKGFIAPNGRLGEQPDVERLYARRVVLAAGSGTADLLAGVGAKLPLLRLASRSLTGMIHREENAPRQTLIDADAGVGIVRFEQRLRVSTALAGKAHAGVPLKQTQALGEVLHGSADKWIPGAARLTSELDSGEQLVGADGLPVIGAVAMHAGRGVAGARARRDADHQGQQANPADTRRVFVSLSGAHRGWGLAFGAAAVLIDQFMRADGQGDRHDGANHGGTRHADAPLAEGDDSATDATAQSLGHPAGHPANHLVAHSASLIEQQFSADRFK